MSAEHFMSASVDESPKPGFPYRVSYHEASDAEVSFLNKKQGRKGLNAFQPSQVARRAVAEAGTAVARMESWISHPDEWVFYRLASKRDERDSKTPWKSLLDPHRQMMMERALADAEERGHFWTPLIDALLENRIIPGAHPFVRQGMGGETVYTPFERRLEDLAEWIGQQDKWESVAPVLNYEYFDAQSLPARCASCLDEDAVREILLKSRELAVPLASNPSLRPELARIVEDWAGNRLCGDGWTADSDELDFIPVRGGGDDSLARHALVELDRAGHELKENSLQSLLNATSSNGAERGYPRHSRLLAFEVLVSKSTPLSEELAVSLYERIKDHLDLVRIMVHSPSVPLETKRLIARSIGDFSIREALTEVPELRKDPVIRKALRKSASSRVLYPLMEDATDAEFDEILPRLFKSEERRGLAAVRKRGGLKWTEEQQHRLALLDKSEDPKVLAELLKHAEGDRFRELWVRLAAEAPSMARDVFMERKEEASQLLSEQDCSTPARAAKMMERKYGVQVLFHWLFEHGQEERVAALMFSPMASRDFMEFSDAEWERVATSRSPALTGENYRNIVLRVLAQFPVKQGLSLLQSAPDWKITAISKLDLAPLLAAPEAWVREEAMRQLRPGMNSDPSPEFPLIRPFFADDVAPSAVQVRSF